MTAPPMANIIPALTSTNPSTPKLLTPTTQPIPLLTSPLSKPLSAAHTLGVLLYYYLRSSHLIANPERTLIEDLIPIVTFQALYCAVCLPSAGLWISGTGLMGRGQRILEGSATASKASRSSGGAAASAAGLRKRVGATQTGSSGKTTASTKTAGDLSGPHVNGGSPKSRILPTLLSTILTLTVPPVPLFVLSLILGAPLYPTALLPTTMFLSLHLSTLIFLPLFYTHGISATAWRDIIAAWLPFDEAGVWGGSIGCLVGGWVGAVPMALDWDREWQRWPCTVLWGAVMGWAVGRVVTGLLGLGRGRRIDLSTDGGGNSAGVEQRKKGDEQGMIEQNEQKAK